VREVHAGSLRPDRKAGLIVGCSMRRRAAGHRWACPAALGEHTRSTNYFIEFDRNHALECSACVLHQPIFTAEIALRHGMSDSDIRFFKSDIGAGNDVRTGATRAPPRRAAARRAA
jgi:hypothetical protein